jgi:hypothetical protein
MQTDNGTGDRRSCRGERVQSEADGESKVKEGGEKERKKKGCEMKGKI